MKPELRYALRHVRKSNGVLGGYPAPDGKQVLVLESLRGRVRRFRLEWPEYLEAFAYWQELLDKPFKRHEYIYMQRKRARLEREAA